MQYLYEKRYYIDLYDLFTIKGCLKTIEFWRKAYKDNQEFLKKYPKKPKMKIEWKTVDSKGNEVKL